MRALCNSFVLEMQLICYKVAANMSFLSDTAQTIPHPPSLGALAIDMHKFLKRLSMPQESGSSSFQHLNKVGSPALPEQKPLRGFVLSSFTAAAAAAPPSPPRSPVSFCPTVPNMLDDVFFFGFSCSFSGSSSTSHKYKLYCFQKVFPVGFAANGKSS